MLTIADVIKLRDQEVAGLLSETAGSFPLVNALPAEPVPGTNVINVPVETSLMDGEFRTENTGRADATPGLSTIPVYMKYLDCSWKIDQQVAQSNWAGVENTLALCAANALKGGMQTLEKQILYGGLTVGGVAYTTGFDGYAKLITQANTVFAGGTSNLSRVIIVAADRGNKLLVGQDGQFAKSEVLYAPINDGTGKQYWGYSQALSMWGGLVVSSASVVQIANIDNGSNTLDDDLIFEALSLFHSGVNPTGIYMSRRSLFQLRNARTAYSPTGAPAPIPTEVAGIPIFVSDSFCDTEVQQGGTSSSSSSSSDNS